MPLAVGVIPARFASTRFPGKVLAPLGNRTMLEEVWRRVRSARRLEQVWIATDDERVRDAATEFGADVRMTDPDHASGTDRVAEVVRALSPAPDVVVNVQADEPLLSPESLDRLVEAFDREPPPQLATLAESIEDPDELFDPNVVKVVVAEDGRALYFSRSPIPFHRGDAARLRSDFREALERRAGGLAGYRKHQGIYAYDRRTLLDLTAREPSALERDEGLEQLRALESGCAIQVIDSDFRSRSVDTPADLEQVTRILTEAS